MRTTRFDAGQLAEAWIDGDPGARWRSTGGHVGEHSGSSLLEISAGRRLPRHTDSAEETIVVIEGLARVLVGDEGTIELGAGSLALVPAERPHEVANAGDGRLRFVALYAAPQVVTTYERDVQPDGGRERRPLGG